LADLDVDRRTIFKMDHQKWDVDIDWIGLALGRDRRLAFVKEVMTIPVPQIRGIS
jgi:hypothetical protein